MKLLKSLFVLFLFLVFYTPSYAAVNSMDLSVCGVVNDDSGKDGDKKEGAEEEEPDCE